MSASKTFTPTNTVDQVTKQNVGETVWDPTSAEFEAVTSPVKAGYTADKATVEAVSVTPTSKDVTVEVKYNTMNNV